MDGSQTLVSSFFDKDDVTRSLADEFFSFFRHEEPDILKHQTNQDCCYTQFDATWLAAEDRSTGSKRSSEEDKGTQPQPRQRVIDAIEETMLSIIEKLALGQPVELAGLANQTTVTSSKRQRLLDEPDDVEDMEGTSRVLVRQPRPLSLINNSSARSFARYLRVMEIVHEALTSNVIVTKRDIYYRDVALFGNQKVVDKIVDDLSCFYNVPRASLHVTAASKGLIHGSVKIILKGNKTIDCAADTYTDDEYCSDEQGVLIPSVAQIAHVENLADFVLVVEKEASFRHLVSAGFQYAFPNGILITGRGYPDIATRHMIKYLWTQKPSMPIWAMVDYDPYGLDIYAVYKWGSRAQAFDSPNLTVPQMKLLGLSAKDKSSLPPGCFMPLTSADRRKAINMVQKREAMAPEENSQFEKGWLDTDSQRESEDHHRFLAEVAAMLYLNLKCELQGLCANGQFGMIEYIRKKLKGRV